MTQSRVLIFLTVAAALLVLGPVPGYPAADPFVRTPYSVPESQDVDNLMVQIEQTVKAGGFDSTALHLQKILDYHAESVVLVGPEEEQRFIGARLWVHAFLRSLPKEGFDAYLKMAAPVAKDLLVKATAERDEKLLLEVIRRYYLSGEGPAALRALSTMCLVEGRYEDAIHYLSALERDFRSEFDDEDAARMAFALVRGSDHAGFRSLLVRRPGILSSKSPVPVGGVEVPLGGFLAPLAERLAKTPEKPPRPDSSWPVYGGTADRAYASPVPETAGIPVWQRQTNYLIKDDDYSYGGRRGWGSSYTALSPVLIPDFFPIHPVIHGGVAYFQNGGTIYAANLLTGKEEWFWNGPLVHSIDGKTNPGTIMSLAVSDRLVIANLEIRVPNMPERGVREFQGRWTRTPTARSSRS
jgi:hypothetical protein